MIKLAIKDPVCWLAISIIGLDVAKIMYDAVNGNPLSPVLIFAVFHLCAVFAAYLYVLRD